ncbi:MAG: hypothetical protein C5B59_05570 [Bacteroidetes bacterium]|nr:MAG: hypothetical protein C5B59_05570 [Bacteroidota bacterium]
MKSDKKKPQKFPEEPEPGRRPEINPEIPGKEPPMPEEPEITPFREPEEPKPAEIPPPEKNDPKTF